MASATTGYARSGDVHVAYRVSGDGPIDVLLVPDGSVPIESIDELPAFGRFLRRLDTFARVIRYDRRGTGLSDPVTPSSPPTLEQWVSDAEAVLDATGCRRTALLGLAEGGFLLCLLAATHPERAISLVLVNSMAGMDAEPFRSWGVAAQTHERLASTIETSWGDVDWAIPLFAPSAVGDPTYQDWLARSLRRFQSPATAASMHDVLYRSDVRDALPSIQAPTLVIHRSGDRYIGPQNGRYLAEHIPGARFVEVPGDDHVPYLGDQTPILDEIERFLAGGRVAPARSRFLATAMFTDVVGSTEMASRLGDASWRDVVDAHHAIVRREIERLDGREIDTAGDGFFVMFDGPARAIWCAASVIRSVADLGLSVRAGVHTGECELVDGKPGGIAVILGSRIAASAAGGQILVSRTVRDLVAGSGLGFVDMGSFRLKGIEDPWQLYAVDLSTAVG